MTKRLKNGRFPKGTSGNLHGRPKGSKNQTALIEEVFNTRISVTENGKRKMVSKREAALIQLANKAASGDLRAAKMLEDLHERHCKSGALSPRIPPEPLPLKESLTEEEAQKLYMEAIKDARSAE